MYNIPEISVWDLKEKMGTENFLILDIREELEIKRVKMNSGIIYYTPMSQLVKSGIKALPAEVQDQSKTIAVLCHHGIRSANVTLWLRNLGWNYSWSVAGGIDAYAREIDKSIGFY